MNVGSAALALDAADGQINGRYYGRPIIQAGGGAGVAGAGATFAGGYGGYGGTTVGAGSSALALDAADGRIDGRYFGRPIVQASPTYTAPIYTPNLTTQTQAVPAYPGVGGTYGSPFVSGGYGNFGYGGGYPGSTFGGFAGTRYF
eukprot:TRINITY_DN6609_c0_g1_i1.p1 TRINITY_DN6609_c0_g1~~TRINITY_DN6609_c0_g1_i1.p1  ORF type:complete len:145 (+),score=26.05 TRINITY_DN6609_c0_g1_i1:38-472(+)